MMTRASATTLAQCPVSSRDKGSGRTFGRGVGGNVDMELSSGLAAFTAKEFRRAMQLLSPLAHAGDNEARFRVAVMYQNGLGMVPDLPAAVTMMSAAAQEGHALAQHALGIMYLEGEGVERDGARAAHWFEQAAEQGLQGSMVALAGLLRSGDGVVADAERARALYRSAGFDPDELPGGG